MGTQLHPTYTLVHLHLTMLASKVSTLRKEGNWYFKRHAESYNNRVHGMHLQAFSELSVLGWAPAGHWRPGCEHTAHAPSVCPHAALSAVRGSRRRDRGQHRAPGLREETTHRRLEPERRGGGQEGGRLGESFCFYCLPSPFHDQSLTALVATVEMWGQPKCALTDRRMDG